MSTISIIVAVARHGAIGRKGDLPFHLSADLKHFKAVTMGKPVVMGRKTYESLPGGALPGRRNIVVTRNRKWTAPGVETASSLVEALALVADVDEVMIIGGGEIYRQALPLADKLYLTEVDVEVADADTHFIITDPEAWVAADSEGAGEWITDARSGIRFRFVNLRRSSEG